MLYLLLLHELRIGTIIYNILAKYRRGQRSIDFFRIYIFQLPIQYEIVAFRAQADCGLLPEQDECEDVAVLFATGEEEVEGVNAVGDCAANDGDPVKDQGGFMGVSKDRQLEEYVHEDDERTEREHKSPYGQRAQRVEHHRKQAHREISSGLSSSTSEIAVAGNLQQII